MSQRDASLPESHPSHCPQAYGTDGTDGTDGTKHQDGPPPAPGFIPPHGGYQQLFSYRKSEIVYDATVIFCRRFVPSTDRTHDQMVQAARSGKQNIIEGSQASGTSREMELKLTNVARASLENCSPTTATSCAHTTRVCGTRTARKPCTCVGSPPSQTSPSSLFAPYWRHGRQRSWRTSSSASSTRPTSCSTGNFARWNRCFCARVVCAKP